MLHDWDKGIGRTILVLYHGLANAWLIGKVFRGIGEERGQSTLALEGLQEGFQRLGQERLAGALGDHLVYITRQDSKNLCAVGRRKMRAG